MEENKTVIFTRPHKTVYATEDTIIKVFDNRYTKAEVLNEARNEALVEENTDLNVPALLSVSGTEEGWCLVREKIEGKTLAQMMEEEPEKLETYMEMFVDLQLTVHSKKVPTIKTLRHKLMDQINSLKDIDATARYELATRLESMPRHKKLCHGDFNPSNVIIDKYNKAWIIDWAHAAPAVHPGRPQKGRALYADLLQEERYRPPVCEPLAPDRGGRTVDQEEGEGERAPLKMDRRS